MLNKLVKVGNGGSESGSKASPAFSEKEAHDEEAANGNGLSQVDNEKDDDEGVVFTTDSPSKKVNKYYTKIKEVY
jgi:hypothetical protein